MEALQQGGYIATTDPDVALAVLRGHDRGVVATNIHSLSLGDLGPADRTAFLNWVFGSGPTAAELARAPAVVLTLDAAEVLEEAGFFTVAAASTPSADAVRLVAAVSALGDRDWRTVMVDALLKLQTEFSQVPTATGWGPPPVVVHTKITTKDPDAVFAVTYGEKEDSFLEGAYVRVFLEFKQVLGEPLGVNQLDSSILHVLRTDERVRPLLQDGTYHVDEVVVDLSNSPWLRAYYGTDRTIFAVSGRGNLVNLTQAQHFWGHDLSLETHSERAAMVGDILALAEKHHLTATADTFKTGVGESYKQHSVVFVGVTGDQSMAQIAFRLTAGGNLVVFFDEVTCFKQPDVRNFLVALLALIPRGALLRGHYRFGLGEDSFDVWHWPEGAESPEQYIPFEGHIVPAEGSMNQTSTNSGSAGAQFIAPGDGIIAGGVSFVADGGEGGGLFARSESDLIAAAAASVERTRSADAVRLAVAVSALGDRDWREAMVEALLALEKKYDAAETPAFGSSTGDGRPPLHVYAKVTVRDPAAVYDVTYGEDAEYEVKEGVYDSKFLEFNQALRALPGMESLDDTLLHVLRTDERLKPLLREVSRIRVNERGLTGPSIYEPGHYVFAVTYEGQLVYLPDGRLNPNIKNSDRHWGHDFSLVPLRSSQRLSSAITTLAKKAGLTVTSGEFSTGFGRSRQRHHAVLVSDGVGAPIAQITFRQTADGKVVVFLDQDSHFGTGLMAPNMYDNFFVKLFDVIPRGTLVRGTYRFAGGDPNFDVWHLPEGAEFPEQYFPPGGYYLYPSLSRREGLSAPYEAKGGEESGSLADVTLSPSPRVEEGGREGEGEPKALAQSTVVGRQPTGGAEQRVHPVMICGGEIVAGGAQFIGNTVLKLDTAVIAEPAVVLEPQPRLRLVESEQPDDDSTIKQLLKSDTSPSANDNVEATGDNFPLASNIINAVGASRIGVHQSAAVRLLALR